MQSIRNFYTVYVTKKYIWAWIGLVFILIGVYFAFRGSSIGQGRVAVAIGTVSESIQVVGKTKPQESVKLGFNSSGRISSSNVKIGDSVKKGKVLASLESADLYANLEKAQSVLDEEKIRLDEVSKNSPQTLFEARQKLSQSIKQAYSLSDGAIRNKTDQFFKSPRTSPRFEVIVVDGTFVHYFAVPIDLEIEVNSERLNIESMLNKWQNDLTLITPDTAQAISQKALSYMDSIGAFLDKIALAVNSFESVNYSYNSTVTAYKSSVDSARSDLSTARSSLVTALQTLSSSPISVDGIISSISIQQAKVNQAQSNVDAIKADIGKATIIAPFDGVIVVDDANIGEVASVGQSLVALISESKMYIEADVSEIKIGKVNIGNDVTITFDAFGGEVFTGTVVFIEPGETVINDVTNYKIRIATKETDSRMKTGLSANLEIKTSEKNKVLTLPIFALKKENNKYFGYKIVGGKSVKVEVRVGLVGGDGLVEVVSGLDIGDELAY